MSGTYQISHIASSALQAFPENPISKSPRLNRLATSGAGAPIFAAFFQWEFSWSAESRSNVAPFFMGRYIAGGLYNCLLPHPITGALVGFTGVAIESVDYTINDVERDTWVDGYRVSLRVNLYATGTV